jgi:signal peptidase II
MYYFIIAAIVFLDQILKYFVRMSEAAMSGIDVIPGIFEIRYTSNTGAAFSILRDQKMLLIVYASVMVAALLAFLIWKRKKESRVVLTAVSLVAAGGIGNLADRVRFGYVVDFIDFDVFPAVFNIADVSVCAGCGLLALYFILSELGIIKRKIFDGFRR